MAAKGGKPKKMNKPVMGKMDKLPPAVGPLGKPKKLPVRPKKMPKF